MVPGGALPLHQAGAVEVNTVEHKKAHVGVLKGRFLEGQEVGAPDERRVEKRKLVMTDGSNEQLETLWMPRVPKGRGLLVCVSISRTSASRIILLPPGNAWGM